MNTDGKAKACGKTKPVIPSVLARNLAFCAGEARSLTSPFGMTVFSILRLILPPTQRRIEKPCRPGCLGAWVAAWERGGVAVVKGKAFGPNIWPAQTARRLEWLYSVRPPRRLCKAEG
jgi:hypothetical protein